MKVVILAGGYGTRLGAETSIRPKPMVTIGDKPILWHIMKHYSHFGFHEFIILLGYKGYLIKEYFANYFLHQNDVTIDLKENQLDIHQNHSESWKITLLNTGQDTQTGGRILNAKPYTQNNPFFLTYGDGVSDIDLHTLLEFHKSHQKLATITGIRPDGRFGVLQLNGHHQVSRFVEKPTGEGAWINGGFFVCNPGVYDYIEAHPDTIFEKAPLEKLASDNQLYIHKHDGFWQCMDTPRDKTKLNELWDNQTAPWKIWS